MLSSMKTNKQSYKVGIYGGSFNPVHFGHIGLAKWVLANTDLDELWFLVSPNNPLKNADSLAPEQERLEAVKQAVKDIPNVKVSDFEFSLPRPSYTANTLRELKKAYPDYEFTLVIGEDNLAIFDRWKEYEYILQNFRIFVYPRKSALINHQSAILNAKNLMFLAQAPYFDISSTEIRNNNSQHSKPVTSMNSFIELCQHRRSIRHYTSQPVEQEKLDYILRCALMAPAGKRLNPWEFVVIRNTDTIRAMAPCREYGSGMFETAMAAIVVALDSAKTDTWQADGAIAAEHILLAAAEQGLGACWCHIYGREDAENTIRSLTGIPQNLTVLCVISLGYKDEERQNYDLAKLQYAKIHNDHF